MLCFQNCPAMRNADNAFVNVYCLWSPVERWLLGLSVQVASKLVLLKVGIDCIWLDSELAHQVLSGSSGRICQA